MLGVLALCFTMTPNSGLAWLRVLRRVRLKFAGGIEVEFADRSRAIGQLRDIARRGTRFPLVVYGPEGCGKTALFKQAKLVLEEHDYHVLYVSPMAEERGELIGYSSSIKSVVREVLSLFPDPYSRIVDASITIASHLVKRLEKPRIAILLDDIFQAVGLDRAEAYVKTLLNLIEYPPGDYESIIVLVSSSEGVTREKIGRHDWAEIRMLWNMSRNGFEELYGALPGPKPSFEYAWSTIGGNPRYLGRLYEAGWNLDPILNWIVRARRLKSFIKSLSSREVEILRGAVREPDTLFERLGEPEARGLIRKLVELNLVAEVWDRDEWSWIDTPPPERDYELGIGKYYAWQTPLHRRAVEKALEAVVK